MVSARGLKKEEIEGRTDKNARKEVSVKRSGENLIAMCMNYGTAGN
jgi:hypothetical protein